MRDETIQCFPKRGYKYIEEVSDEGITTISSSGHYAKIFLGPNETTGVNLFNDRYVFSGTVLIQTTFRHLGYIIWMEVATVTYKHLTMMVQVLVQLIIQRLLVIS